MCWICWWYGGTAIHMYPDLILDCEWIHSQLRLTQWLSARSRLEKGAADAIATAEEQRPKATPAVRIQHLQAESSPCCGFGLVSLHLFSTELVLSIQSFSVNGHASQVLQE